MRMWIVAVVRLYSFGYMEPLEIHAIGSGRYFKPKNTLSMRVVISSVTSASPRSLLITNSRQSTANFDWEGGKGCSTINNDDSGA